LGLALAGCAGLLARMNLEPLSIDIVLVVLLAVFTGGMHLDGLADTADALFSGKTKDEMLRIMREPHTGVMGTLGIIIAILLKIAFLFSIDRRMLASSLILMCVLSRWSMVTTIFLFPYARQDGKAKIFIQGINYRIVLVCSLITLGIVALAWPFGGILVFLLSGPATNTAGIITIAKFLGKRTVVIYLAAISACAIGMGFLLNYIYITFHIDIMTVLGKGSHSMLAHHAGIVAAPLLIILMINAKRRKIARAA